MNAKIKPADIALILSRRRAGLTLRFIASLHGVTKSTIHRILSRLPQSIPAA